MKCITLILALAIAACAHTKNTAAVSPTATQKAAIVGGITGASIAPPPATAPSDRVRDVKKRIWLGYLLINMESRRVVFLFIEDDRVSMENAVAPEPIREENGNMVFVAPTSMFQKAEVVLSSYGEVSVRHYMEDCVMTGPVQRIGAQDYAAGISGVAYKAYITAEEMRFSPGCKEFLARHANDPR